ncbi:MAG: hypothetical protein ABR913_06500 [Sedimentisphaerales bacterium]|jgi:L-fucose isomerase
MTVKSQAKCLPQIAKANPKVPVIGVFAPCDPRIDEQSRTRAKNIVLLVASAISGKVVLPGNVLVPVVYSAVLVDSESQADIVAQQFRQAGVDILVCAPDTWAFPQLTTISLLQQFPGNTPLNITCGNSGPKPGVVYAQALNGALSQSGRMVHLNVGKWADTGIKPKMTEKTAEDLIDWCYAAVTAVALRGRRVMIFGHDSMGMETALAHILPTRNTFGLEITRLDMKLLADMLAKQAYDKKELKKLRGWIDRYIGDRLELKSDEDSFRFDQSLAMYLINRDLMAQLNAVGGGFMSQLEWGSDLRGRPLPVADCMESLFNSTFDHNGKKPSLPFATEADMQALLTMLFMTYLTGGNPPLFMDFRKVWEGWEIKQLAEEIGVTDLPDDADWLKKGLVDGNNSGSASFDWAAMPGAGVKEIMNKISMPLADAEYFPGGGNSLTFMTPAGIEGIAGRMAYGYNSDKFSFIWDQAVTTEVPEKLSQKMVNLTNWNWPHTFLVPKYASMIEYKQYAPANHLHMVWGLPTARLQYWMDLTGVLSVTPWAARPKFIEGVDRPQPLIHLINGGEDLFRHL